MPARLVNQRNLNRLLTRLRRGRKKIVFTNGVFDIIHRGHVEYLTKAASFGDVLIVGLNSDKSARRLKGKSRPVQSEKDRAVILAALRPVDYVVVFGEDTPDKLIARIRPDVLVKGADYAMNAIVGATLVRSYGGRVRRIRLTAGRSTSKLLKKLT
ncbi:MAG: D-glycero-beta-D-manno-heptose 1-phosphate adenylyltransferase [Candidatus Zixiibacteriota bacterium]|nr:MAG: D-glycero-beta-D-manno-heptose 1-phosphate adenylyltransferase [candidate division Zixibacteria bacterium]